MHFLKKSYQMSATPPLSDSLEYQKVKVIETETFFLPVSEMILKSVYYLFTKIMFPCKRKRVSLCT